MEDRFLRICFGVCVWGGGVGMCMHLCASMWGPEDMAKCFPLSLSTYSYKTGSVTEQKLHVLASLAVQQAPGMCLTSLFKTGVTCVYSHA